MKFLAAMLAALATLALGGAALAGCPSHASSQTTAEALLPPEGGGTGS